MPGYRRPDLRAPEIRDEHGQVISFGTRWRHRSGPPAELYSVERFPERFAPLHQVADALAAHLQSTYRVRAEPGVLERRAPSDVTRVIRSIRLVPEESRASALTIAWTGYPGIRTEYGHLASASYPQCGCEACDESWESAADELEEDVLALVEGRYGERLTELEGRPATGTFVVDAGGRSVQSSTTTSDLLPSSRQALGRTLDQLPGGRWPPWPAR